MAHVCVTLEWFKLTKSHDGDDEEDLDVSITVDGHMLYVKSNENHVVNQPYGHKNKVEIDVVNPKIHIVGGVTCADYHNPHYGSVQFQHVTSGIYTMSSALNGGAWEARYHVTFG